MALVGFDDIVLADAVSPGLTVVAQDPGGLGRAAAELLFERLDGFDGPSRRSRAADAADRPRVGRAAAGLRSPLSEGSAGCNGLQERAHRTVLAIVCQLRFASRMAVRRSAAPTLADVAVEAGVSQATASRALAGSPLVNANTRQRVWDVAERLHFQPNRLARSLRSGATMAVGLVVPDVGAAFYASALKSAQDVLEAAGYHVLVLNTGRSPEREREALLTLRAHQVDGLLVATSGGYEEIGVPAVFFDSVPSQPDAGAVSMDNEAGIRLLVDHLVSVHGQERIAYLGPPESLGTGALQGTGRERLEAFRAAVGRAGLPLPPEYVRTSEPALSEESGRAAARELMALAQPPTAIVGGTDELAIGLLRGLRDARAAGAGRRRARVVRRAGLGRPARPAAHLPRPPRRPARPPRRRGAAADPARRGRRDGDPPRPRRAERPPLVWVRRVMRHAPFVGFGVDKPVRRLQPFASLQSIARTTG